jgi:SAM-dependent methyltransferase
MWKDDVDFNPPNLSPSLMARIVECHFHQGRHVNRMPPQRVAENSLSIARAREHLEIMQHLLPPEDGLMLDIGSGFGILPYYAYNKHHIDVYGIEADEEVVSLSADVMAELMPGHSRIIHGVGENLPFPSNSMDLVCSFNVFEHVAVPERVLAESIRVLKPGGHLYFSFPSYGSWWEGHYGVLWFPGLPKWLAKIYVVLLGRRPHFIDTLQFITHRRLQKILAPVRDQVDIVMPDFGQSLWEERLRTMAFSEWAQLSVLKRWVRVLHQMKLVEPFIAVGRVLHWETPFLLVLRKR